MHNGLHLLSLYQPPIRGIFSLLSLYQPPIRGIFFTEMEGLQNSTYGASHMQGAVTIQTFIRKQQALSRWPESQKILKFVMCNQEAVNEKNRLLWNFLEVPTPGIGSQTKIEILKWLKKSQIANCFNFLGFRV